MLLYFLLPFPWREIHWSKGKGMEVNLRMNVRIWRGKSLTDRERQQVTATKPVRGRLVRRASKTQDSYQGTEAPKTLATTPAATQIPLVNWVQFCLEVTK